MSHVKYLVYNTSNWWDGASESESLEEAMIDFEREKGDCDIGEHVFLAQVINRISGEDAQGLSPEDLVMLRRENEEYLEKHFQTRECPVCSIPISFMLPSDFSSGMSLSVPASCEHGWLYISNLEGEIKEYFQSSEKVIK